MQHSPFFFFIILFLINIPLFSQMNALYFPASDWSRYDSVELAGFDKKKLDDVYSYVVDSMNTTGLVVVVNGKIILEQGDIQELSYIASIRKSLLSMLFGKYVEEKIIDLDMTLEQLKIHDVNELLPIEREATIRNLITARSGIFLPSSNGSYELQFAPKRGSVKPGTYHIYNNWDFNAAGAIFEMLTGKDIYKSFEEDIALPIQMQDYKVENQKKVGDTTQSKFLAYHFLLSTRDMARLGLLMLCNGNWNGKQLIPKDWIKLSTCAVTPPDQINTLDLRDGNFGYGYMWWIWCSNDEILKGSYWARGAMGQYIVVIPYLNMVIANKTKPDYGRDTSFPQFEKLVNMITHARLD